MSFAEELDNERTKRKELKDKFMEAFIKSNEPGEREKALLALEKCTDVFKVLNTPDGNVTFQFGISEGGKSWCMADGVDPSKDDVNWIVATIKDLIKKLNKK